MAPWPVEPAAQQNETGADTIQYSGKELLITASGTIKKRIEQGAKVKISVKYGLIKLLTTEADLCEQIANVDLECPLEPGDRDIVKTVDLPAEIPPVRNPLIFVCEQCP